MEKWAKYDPSSLCSGKGSTHSTHVSKKVGQSRRAISQTSGREVIEGPTFPHIFPWATRQAHFVPLQ